MFIKKAQVEEKRLYLDNLALSEQAPRKSKVPPPPILLSRRDTTMVFKPAPFTPAGGEKVSEILSVTFALLKAKGLAQHHESRFIVYH